MNKISLLTIVLLIACNSFMSFAYADRAMQQVDTRSVISLDGRWDAIVDPTDSGTAAAYFKNLKPASASDLVEYDFAAAPKLQVPGDWNTQSEKGWFYEGIVWYHRDFQLTKKPNQQYFIYFGAVNYSADVYVNGQLVGEHEGGYTPFQFDITPLLKAGDNSLVVKVDNSRERDHIPALTMDWWNYGGIIRSVKIIEVPNTHIADYFIQLGKGDDGAIEGWVKISTVNKKLDNQKIDLRIPELGIAQKIALNNEGEAEFSIAAKPQLWSPEQPKLYSVEISYQQETLYDKIGFRQLHVQGDNIFLNGKSIYLKGINLPEESPLHPGRAWSDEDARLLLQWAKELGCNFVRLVHYPHSENIVRLADQMGLMLWAEIPVYGSELFNNPAVYNKAEEQLEELITRDKNRAAVIIWSVANATPNTPARLKFVGQLVQKARELDDTRLISAALNMPADTAGEKVIDDPLAGVLDIIGINNDCGWNGLTASACAKLKWVSNHHKPVIFTSLGGEAVQGRYGDKSQRWTEEFQSDLYANNLVMADSIHFVRGVSAAALIDVRSPRRQLANLQDFWDRSGLLSAQGIKKKAWHVVHDYYTKQAPTKPPESPHPVDLKK